ncbi:MAG: OmpA family protein [Prevotellaceae bacterium]|jgi:outer membrane protein OmpA-like peptidoglycan-associated protein|nr:OmpA family protein [Prevotellaceae bacterium]
MKKILLTLLITVIVAKVVAQTDSTFNAQEPYQVPKITQNWFVSVGGGANIYFGEFDKHGNFGKRISYAGKLSIGKWITPSVALRVQFDIAGMKGFLNPYSTQFTVTDIALNHIYGDYDSDGYYKEKFNYFNSHIDLLFSIFKYEEKRFYQLIPYIGAGYAFRFGHGENGIHEGEFTLNTGIVNRFRLSNALDLDVEIGGMFVNQRFDGVHGGQMLEGGLTATVGINIKLGKTKTFKRQEKCDNSVYENQILNIKNDYENRIKNLSNDLSNAQNKINDYEKQINDKSKQNEQPTDNEQKIVSETFDAVLFEVNSSVIRDESKLKIDKIIDILKKYTNITVKLSGHADSSGSISYNQKLSEQRAEAVKKYLQEKGITATIETEGYGEEHSIATNKTTDGRAKNRRTEIEIKIN